MTREVQSLRQHHNIAPDNCIEATAIALWRHVSHQDLERVLAQIGPDAVAFWRVSSRSDDALQPGII